MCPELPGNLQISQEPMGKAGDGNRTHMASLEGWNFTTKLHPQNGARTIVPHLLLSILLSHPPPAQYGDFLREFLVDYRWPDHRSSQRRGCPRRSSHSRW